jgi:alpha-soluble NSF attachment protein
MSIEAGRAFEKAAQIQTSIKEPDDAANTYADCFKTYRKDSPQDAARCLQIAIQHYTLKGNFRRAATNEQHLAEMWEELGETKNALQAYDTAAMWYEQDNADALANKLFLKTADLAALEGEYARSIALYERVAKSSINNNLMKWSVKSYLLHAGMVSVRYGMGEGVHADGPTVSSGNERSGCSQSSAGELQRNGPVISAATRASAAVRSSRSG